jgi:hypothetical protein
MSQYDRGPYAEGGEAPLAFEARRPVRSGGPAPITLVLSLLILGAIGGGVFFLYRGGIRGTNDAPRPVGAPIGDVRTLAPAQAQAPDAAAGLSIYKDTSADASPGTTPPAPAFAAPPESPTPRPQAAASVAAPSPPPTALAKPVVAPVAPPARAALKPSDESDSVAANPPVGPPSAAEPATRPMDTGGGPAVVQIGAFASESQADKGWDSAAGIAPGAMAGKGKKVEAVSRSGETFYRTSITGFSNRAEAKALCDKLEAAGRTCFVR